MHGSSWFISGKQSPILFIWLILFKKISDCQFRAKPKNLSLFFSFPWSCVHRSLSSIRRRCLRVNAEVTRRNITSNQSGWGTWPLSSSLFKVAWLSSFVLDNSILHDVFPYLKYCSLANMKVLHLEKKVQRFINEKVLNSLYKHRNELVINKHLFQVLYVFSSRPLRLT